jgi:hypothetical protein
MPTAPIDRSAPVRDQTTGSTGITDFSAQQGGEPEVAIMGGAAAGQHDGGFEVAGLGEITPEALAAEFPQWRQPARAGDAWITMRSGPQEYHGPASLTLRTLSAPTIRDLEGKLRFQTA